MCEFVGFDGEKLSLLELQHVSAYIEVWGDRLLKLEYVDHDVFFVRVRPYIQDGDRVKSNEIVTIRPNKTELCMYNNDGFYMTEELRPTCTTNGGYFLRFIGGANMGEDTRLFLKKKLQMFGIQNMDLHYAFPASLQQDAGDGMTTNTLVMAIHLTPDQDVLVRQSLMQYRKGEGVAELKRLVFIEWDKLNDQDFVDGLSAAEYGYVCVCQRHHLRTMQS